MDTDPGSAPLPGVVASKTGADLTREWKARQDGWEHTDVSERTLEARFSHFHGLMLGVHHDGDKMGSWVYVDEALPSLLAYITKRAPGALAGERERLARAWTEGAHRVIHSTLDELEWVDEDYADENPYQGNPAPASKLVEQLRLIAGSLRALSPAQIHTLLYAADRIAEQEASA